MQSQNGLLDTRDCLSSPGREIPKDFRTTSRFIDVDIEDPEFNNALAGLRNAYAMVQERLPCMVTGTVSRPLQQHESNVKFTGCQQCRADA